MTTMVLLLVALAAALITCGRHEQTVWHDRWPPISDDEFMARCKPGTSREVALKVRRIVAEQLDIPYERVHPDQHFVDDLDCC